MVSFKNVSSVGGNGIVPLAFEDYVPKYDASSFYNWEQDNIPLWSLEERDNTLYNLMGSPGGNPEGVTFTLSSTGNFDESKAVFDNIEDIVERIPKRLKFPVLIELCAYGNLGKLELANITCEGNGKLEIRNKAYFEGVNASANVVSNVDTDAVGTISTVSGVYSRDASSQMLGASSTRLGVVFGNNDSLWRDGSRIFCMQGPDSTREANNLTVHIGQGGAIAGAQAVGAGSLDTNGQYALSAWGYAQDYTTRAGDAIPFWGSGEPVVGVRYNNSGRKDHWMMKNATFTDGKRENKLTMGQSTMFGAGNYFSSVKVKDCQGTIILRNLVVDGSNNTVDAVGDGGVNLNDYGFEIDGSEVYLDNTASIKNKKAGYFAKNARLKITGHCVAWRNYFKDGNSTEQKYRSNANRKSDGTGMYCINTDIEFDSTAYENSRKYLNWFGKSEYGIQLKNSTVRGGIYSTITSALPSAGSLLSGIDATDGASISLLDCSGSGGDTMTTIINTPDCNTAGIYLEGSDFEFYGRLNSYLNQGDGIRAVRSQLNLSQFTINHNGGVGINLESSNLIYGFGIDDLATDVGAANYYKPDQYYFGPNTWRRDVLLPNQNTFGNSTGSTTLRPRNRAQFHCSENNQNIVINKSSSISPVDLDNKPKYLGRWGGADWRSNDSGGDDGIGQLGAKLNPMNNFGATPYRQQNLPGILVTNNSDAELLGVNYAVSSSDTGKGKVAIASNGSNITFRGTASGVTNLTYYPVATAAEQFRSWLAAGVVADRNSTVEFTGPTKLSRFGVPILGEDNSNVSINPPTLPGTDRILDVSGYDLLGDVTTSSNHTSLEVHSTRSCAVVNRNSSLRLYALGGRVVGTSDGNEAFNSVDVLATGYADALLKDEFNQFQHATSGGHVKFYPNGFTSGIGAYSPLTKGVSLASFNDDVFDITKNYILNNNAATTAYNRHEAGTTGGMCVRATGGSNVDANLVNFLMWVSPSSVSGAIYNYNGLACENGVDVQPPITNGTGGAISTPTTPVPIPPDAGTPPGDIDSAGNAAGGRYGTLRNGGRDGVIVDDSETNVVGAYLNREGQGQSYATVGTGNSGDNNFIQTESNPGSPNTIGDQIGIDAENDGGGSMGYTNRIGMYMRKPDNSAYSYDLSKEVSCMGSPIHMWNVADTSRIHASNCLINGGDPRTICQGDSNSGANAQNFHGPSGKWWNGVSLDYFGAGGRRTTYGQLDQNFHNNGIFRLVLSTRGDVKGMYDVSALSGTTTGAQGWNSTALSGGSFADQANGQGYTHWTANTRMLAGADDLHRAITGGDSDMPGGIYSLSSCLRVFGWGLPARMPNEGVATMAPRLGSFSSFNATSSTSSYDNAWIADMPATPMPIPPLHMDWQGYMRNWFDDSASNTFQNVKHLAEDKVNGVSIYRSNRGGFAGGEGREPGHSTAFEPGSTMVSFGAGVRSMNLFDFERLM
tara:strand:- start:1713 stop:6080 length:4368 start_codon:yes stop_codon:yes gene_type:complete